MPKKDKMLQRNIQLASPLIKRQDWKNEVKESRGEMCDYAHHTAQLKRHDWTLQGILNSKIKHLVRTLKIGR